MTTQLLQTLSILIENLRSETSLCTHHHLYRSSG